MYLKRLELSGFKSFAEKTVLDFPSGITAVVGPNGSGKSNIIDAIRWLLGEREAKNMRGVRAEDLIFAGTAERAKMSLAQAAIVFNNREHFFPVDFEEVAIRRRMLRDGTSTYLLNDAEVRAKDIIDFFAKARLGTKGFAIINQGSSDMFVRASARERREMLEEMLGLRQYQLKKHDAELKLKNTRINMEKAHALIEEIVPHLKLLKRQTAKWAKHDELREKLSLLEEGYFSLKLFEFNTELEKIAPRLKALRADMVLRKREFEDAKADVKKLESAAPKEDAATKFHSKEREEIVRRQAEINKELGRLEVQIELATESTASPHDAREAVHLLEETRQTLEDVLRERDLEIIHELLEALFEKINHLLDGESKEDDEKKVLPPDFVNSKKRLSEELKGIEEKLTMLGRHEQTFTDELKGFNEKFKIAVRTAEAKREALSTLEESERKLIFDEERIGMRRTELEHQARQIGRALHEFSPKESKERFDVSSAEREMLRLRGELATIGEVDPAIVKEAEETEARHTFLTTQLADLEKAFQDLKVLIKDLDEKIHTGFKDALTEINKAFNEYFRMMFGGGQGKLTLEKEEVKKEEVLVGEEEVVVPIKDDEDRGHSFDHGGIEISISIPRKKVGSLDALSGGEKALVSIAVLFALISVSPPPFLVLDEVDAPLDEANTKRFANLIREFSKKTQFLVVTHNRATMEAADILYGVTMAEDGTSKVISLKLE